MINMIKPIKIVEVKSEIGAGTRGASMGVEAIEIAALDFGSNFFKQFPPVEIQVENQMLFEPARTPYARRVKGVYQVCERVANEVKNSLLEKNYPIVLSGDHSTSIGT